MTPGEETPTADIAQDTPHSANTSLHRSLLGPSLLKAGQDGVDQQKIGEIIYDASKGSKFFEHEQRRDEQLTKRIKEILKHKKELDSSNLSRELRKADEEIDRLEESRDLTQVIVHVDCDAFYASVEELDRPELKNLPMAVGGGVLTTCNYKAREFGVRSGMAGHIAKKICPQLVFLPLSFHKYTAKAQEVRAVLVKYDERYEAASVDEAFLNITGYLEENPEMTPDTLVEQIRNEVLEATKISISAGIGPNAKIAKIGSNKNKPNGQFRVPNNRQAVMDFMDSLAVRKVNGIGRVFERELEAVGIKTCGDIYPARAIIRQLFGEKAFMFLLHCYLGIGRTEIHPVEEYERKSVGTERTFRDLSGAAKLREKLRHIAEELEEDLAKTQQSGKTLVLKIKLHTYQVLTRQRVLTRAVCTAEDLYNFSLPLLQALETEFAGKLTLRLMGLRVTQLMSTDKKKVSVDINKWFFGNSGTQKQHSAVEVDGDGWEVWPEEEFEQEEAAEQQEEMKLTQELSEELEEHERSSQVENSNQTWDCPICARPQPADDQTFNQHIDFCLSKTAIRDAVHESSNSRRSSSGGSEGKRSRDNDSPVKASTKRRFFS